MPPTPTRPALAALLFAGALGCAHASPSGAPIREGHLAASDGTKLYYRLEGAGPDTVVAIHGGPGVDLESIRADFLPLAARHTVIFYDQRGAGRSDLPADKALLTADKQVSDLEDVRRHFGLEKMTLVAHSYGPLLAASYALAHPDRVQAMVFFGPVPPYQGDLWKRVDAAMTKGVTPAMTAKMADAERRLQDPNADARQACQDYWAVALRPRLAEPDRSLPLLKSDLCASDPRGIRYGLTTTNAAVMESYGKWDLREPLRALQVPVLVVHGEEAAIPMDMVEAWATSLPHARLLKVPRAAHFAYAEQPALVWPEVEKFLGP